jgi:hypothetical protein
MHSSNISTTSLIGPKTAAALKTPCRAFTHFQLSLTLPACTFDSRLDYAVGVDVGAELNKGSGYIAACAKLEVSAWWGVQTACGFMCNGGSALVGGLFETGLEMAYVSVSNADESSAAGAWDEGIGTWPEVAATTILGAEVAGAGWAGWWLASTAIAVWVFAEGTFVSDRGTTSGGRRGLKCSFKAVKEQRTTLLFKENIEMVIFAVSKMSLAETKSQRVTKSQKSRRKRSSGITTNPHRKPKMCNDMKTPLFPHEAK